MTFKSWNYRIIVCKLFSIVSRMVLPVLRIRDVYPGSWFLPIPDPGSRIPDLGSRILDPTAATKERGERKLDVKPFYVATKFNKIVNYFSFEVLKKKFWANFQRIIELFTKKMVKKLFKIWSWDPGSGKNPFRILDPGSRCQKGTGSGIRIRDPDPQNWFLPCFFSPPISPLLPTTFNKTRSFNWRLKFSPTLAVKISTDRPLSMSGNWHACVCPFCCGLSFLSL